MDKNRIFYPLQHHILKKSRIFVADYKNGKKITVRNSGHKRRKTFGGLLKETTRIVHKRVHKKVHKRLC